MKARMWRVIPIVAALWLPRCTSSDTATADLDLLRALHEKVMLAHRRSDVEILLGDDAADYVVAGRGAVTRPSLEDRRERLGSYLRSTTFREYRDVVEPVVRISRDGTLGWVIVQVEASGVQKTQEGGEESLEFGSAWIELYEKRDGRWLRIGNVSNFKPQP